MHKHSNKREYSFSILNHNLPCINLCIMRVLKPKSFKRREHVCSRHLHNHSCTKHSNKRESSFSILNHNLPCINLGIMNSRRREHTCSRHSHNHSCTNIQIKESISSLYSTITFHAWICALWGYSNINHFKRWKHVCSRRIPNHSCTNIQNKRDFSFSILTHNLLCHKFGHYEGTQT